MSMPLEKAILQTASHIKVSFLKHNAQNETVSSFGTLEILKLAITSMRHTTSISFVEWLESGYTIMHPTPKS